MSTDAEGRYIDKGRRSSGAALWVPGVCAVALGLLGLLFVQNIFLGQMLAALVSIGGSFVAAGCVVSAVRDRTHGRQP